MFMPINRLEDHFQAVIFYLGVSLFVFSCDKVRDVRHKSRRLV
jgi:hypothetical protein